MVGREISRLLSLAFAHNTHKVYNSGWSAFCRFLQAQSHPAHAPVAAQTICEFIAWLSLQHYSPSTIVTYVAGVGCHFKLSGRPDPTGTFIVTKLLEGCRRGDARLDQRSPISPPLLAKILAVLPFVCSSIFEVKLFQAAMLLAFFGFLRVGEFAATSRARVHAHVLQVGDIHFLGPNQGSATEYVLVSLRHSKNNQHGPPQQIHIGQAIDASPCPVHALKGFLKVRPRMHGNFNSTRFCRRHCHGWGFRVHTSDPTHFAWGRPRQLFRWGFLLKS